METIKIDTKLLASQIHECDIKAIRGTTSEERKVFDGIADFLSAILFKFKGGTKPIATIKAKEINTTLLASQICTCDTQATCGKTDEERNMFDGIANLLSAIRYAVENNKFITITSTIDD